MSLVTWKCSREADGVPILLEFAHFDAFEEGEEVSKAHDKHAL
jgi:hypothetical protein